jgi:hypothetical protein
MQVAEPITITAGDRDLLCHRTLVNMSGIDRIEALGEPAGPKGSPGV